MLHFSSEKRYSEKPLEDSVKIAKCIMSCTTESHVDVCRHMITLLVDKWNPRGELVSVRYLYELANRKSVAIKGLHISLNSDWPDGGEHY